MELIRDADTDSFKASYTKALIDTAKCVGVQVICEGIETDSEQWLRAHSADYVEGFYFSRPLGNRSVNKKYVAVIVWFDYKKV